MEILNTDFFNKVSDIFIGKYNEIRANIIGGNNYDADIEKELAKLHSVAELGYELALKKYEEIQQTLNAEAAEISQTDRKQDETSRIKNVDKLKSQLQDVRKISAEIMQDIQTLHDNQKKFSIVVYGRTMAGKSTLMEVLTRGDGSSIGQGAQRTTRDIREYAWHGLTFIDTPGICSFEDNADDKIALEAAKTADLILFLLSDDGQQEGVPQALANLRKLGKPVLGIVNVKMNFNIEKREIDLRRLNNRLADKGRIEDTWNQFKEYAANYNQVWESIPFVYVHLLSAFEAQRANDAEIYQASHFPEVEKFILDKLRSDGKFLRIKNFIDGVSVPMQKIIDTMFIRAGITLLESHRIYEKRVELYEWRKQFLSRAQVRLDSFAEEVQRIVDKEAYDFANTYYDRDKENIESLWQSRFNDLHLPEKCAKVLKGLAAECEKKCRDLSDELIQERPNYTFDNSINVSVELQSLTDWKNIFGVGGGILAVGLMFSNPVTFAIGIFGVASALISFAFDDKETKIRENKKKLRESLTQATDPVLEKMHQGVIDIFNEKILGEYIDGFAKALENFEFTMSWLGYSQSELASSLANKYMDLNFELLNQAIKYSKLGGKFSGVKHSARVPGEKFLFIADSCTLDVKKVSNVLGNNFIYMNSGGDDAENVKRILGCDFEFSWYPFTNDENAEGATAIKPVESINPTDFKLAQQIAGVPILEG